MLNDILAEQSIKVRTGRAVRCGSVRYWALAASLLLHAGALAVFTGVKLSGSLHSAAIERPSITMQAIQRASIQPKPVPRVEAIVAPVIQPPADEPPLVVTTKQEPSPEQPRQPLHAETVQADTVEEPGPAAASAEVEFFGQKSAVQHVCYVVDCSGSMYGQMYRVKEQLKESILKLNSSHAFCVIFFLDGRRIMMSGDGRLEAATPVSKSRALQLIAAIKPAGTTDAAHALETAMRLKGDDGRGPQVIYFLTDGFDLDETGSQDFVQTTESLRQTLAPEAMIHTIGFSPEAQDRNMLFALARNAGGGYVEVN